MWRRCVVVVVLFFFFFKQMTAYEISAGLVGSEMGIRDRARSLRIAGLASPRSTPVVPAHQWTRTSLRIVGLLYPFFLVRPLNSV